MAGLFKIFVMPTWAIKGIKCLFVGDACNILLNVFSDQNVREYVEAQINLVWDKLESDVEAFLPFLKHLESILKLQIGQYFSEGSLEREMVLVWLAEMLIELITQSSSKFNNFMISLFISVSPLWILLVILW